MSFEETYYLKDFLTSSGIKDENKLLKNRKIWELLFIEAAYLAGIFHDIGYPWQYIKTLNNNLTDINTGGLKNSQDSINIKNQFKHRLLYCPLNGYKKLDPAMPSNWDEKLTVLTENAVIKTHGFQSALALLFLNDCIREYPDKLFSPFQLLCVEWAAMAVMMHDMGKIYWGNGKNGIPENPFLRLSFKKDPLSALVTLADTIQDFERPVGFFSDSTANWVKLKYKPQCKETSIDVKNSTLAIKYNMYDKKDIAVRNYYLKSEYREIFEPKYGYLDTSSLGISKVKLEAY